MNKQQEPRLRFKGFTDAWEEKVLGEVTEYLSDGTHFSPKSKNGEYKYITSKNIRNSGFDLSDISYISAEEHQEIYKRCSVKFGDLLLTKDGASTGNCCINFLDEEFSLLSSVAVLRPKQKEHNAIFLCQLLQSPIGQNEIKGSMAGQAITRITLEKLRAYKFNFPLFEEQTHLGLFFRRLDSQIAESRAVLEKSRQLKKAMLAKMFPTNGEKIPEIRFKGFEGEWESRKLGEIAFKVKEKNIAYQYAETFTNSAEFGIISQQDFFDKSISNSENIGGYYVVQPDDFVYNPRISSFAPVGPIKRNKLGRTGVMSPLYYVFRLNDEIKPSYLEQYFEGNQWHHFMYLNGDTGARSDRFSIKNDVFAEMPISFPANKNEQTQIGNFFRQLDETIALQSAEVEKLNQLKKGLLAAMLV